MQADDIGLTAEHFYTSSANAPPQPPSPLSLAETDDFLDRLAACSAERQLQVEPQRPALLSRPDDTHAAEQRRQLLFRLLRRRVRDRMAPLS